MRIERVAPNAISDVSDALVSIYRAAFTAAPYCESEADVRGFELRLARHAVTPGFRLFVAHEPGRRRVVGFTYGYTGRPGGWWHDRVASVLGSADAARWLADCFETVELAVLPEARGQGIGGRLHDALLAGLIHRTAVLSTLAQETPAMRLYRGRGWQVLAAPFYFPGSPLPYAIMGRELPFLSAPPRPVP